MGTRERLVREAREREPTWHRCTNCNGDGNVGQTTCPDCGGEGGWYKEETK